MSEAADADARACLERAADLAPGRPLLRWVEGTGVLADEAGAAAFVLEEANPLDEAGPPVPPAGAAEDGPPRIAWSGSLAGPFPGAFFAATPLNWTRPGRAALDAWLDGLGPAVRARLHLRPHARHVLSDPPSVRAWWRERSEAAAGGPPPVAGVALDLAGLLEPAMLADAEDHLQLLPRNLGDLASVVLLAGVRVVGGEEDRCRPVPFGGGEDALPDAARPVLASALATFVPPDVPLAVRLPAPGA